MAGRLPRSRKKDPERKTGLKTIRVISKLKTIDGEDIVEEFDTEIFQTDPAQVRASCGITKNLGNYESLRVDVSVTMPCYKEDIERTYDVASEVAAVLLQEEVNRHKHDLGCNDDDDEE